MIGSDDDRLSAHLLGYIKGCVPVYGVCAVRYSSKGIADANVKKTVKIFILTCLFNIRVDLTLN